MSFTVYPHLPPTSNLLSSQQRTRLLRSTRKLGAVLGTTPYLLENDMSFTMLPFGKTTPRALKRQGSVFIHRQPSSLSVTSIATTSSASSADLPVCTTPGTQRAESHPTSPPGLPGTRKARLRIKPPPLCLQLNAVPVSPTSDRLTPVPSPLPSPRTTPPTPTTPVPDVATTRRKRMAKLARHLGENVPVELVFTPDPPPKSHVVSPDRYQRGRSQSVHALSDDVARVCPNRTPPMHLHSHSHSHSKQEWVGEWNRPSIRDVQKELRNLRIR